MPVYSEFWSTCYIVLGKLSSFTLVDALLDKLSIRAQTSIGSIIILSSVKLAAALKGYFSLTAHLAGPAASRSYASPSFDYPCRVYDLSNDKIV